jgi:glycine/D-amino acid oxidase-like deaminating enzyme
VNARQVTGIKTTTGEFEAPVVVVAAGGWAERLFAPLGIALKMRYRRGVIVFYEQPRENSPEFPILLDASGAVFCRPHPYRMCCVGMVSSQPQAQGVDNIDEYVTPGEETGASRYLAGSVPALANLSPKRSHAIVYDTLGDGKAALGRIQGINGLYAAVGFGTSAFSVAPAAGETLAKLIVDGTSEIDISSLDPLRVI